MNTTHYSLSADSRRWWWPSAAAGAAASAAIAALVAVPAGAIPDHDPGLGTGADVVASTGAGTAAGAGGTGGTDTGTTATTAVFRTGGEGRPCFLVRAHWNNALDAQQPVCGLDAPREKESRGVAGTRLRVADCPPPPDVRYVGLPWVPTEPTGCASLDRWWTVVPVG